MESRLTAVVTRGDSDFLALMRASGIPVQAIAPEDIPNSDLGAYGAICILGGTEREPLALTPKEAACIRRQIAGGQRVFVEYSRNVDNIYFMDVCSTRYERPVFVSDDISVEGLAEGDILDEQCNDRMSLWRANYHGRPLLQYVRNVDGFYKTKVTQKKLEDTTNTALWFEKENLLVCSFRLCNFVRGRFAPAEKWDALIAYLVKWITGAAPSLKEIANGRHAVCRFHGYQDNRTFEEQAVACAKAGIEWFSEADMLLRLHGQIYGVREGMGPAVYADGTQQVIDTLRTDCTGEASTAFFFDHLFTGSPFSSEAAEGMLSIYYDVERKDEGFFNGMSGGLADGKAVYQDDAARGLLFTLLFRALYTGEEKHLPLVRRSLDFLLRTTGTDGLRVVRTDIRDESDMTVDVMHLEAYTVDGVERRRWAFFPQDVRELAGQPGGMPSGHYNAFYLAALLLAYRIMGDEQYREVGVRGMENIMACYPETEREVSETEELCRLILPLSLLYWVTGEEKHREWLYRVTKDLQRLRHKSGAYLEWDTGYKAVCSSVKDNECSILAKNGDPVADLLYSLNWLPMGFIQAYFVTGDMYFYDLWRDIVQFFISVQLESPNKQLNGGWPRAIDVDRMEVYGVPNDIGWAPWSIESGWTVGEVVSGIYMGLMKERLMSLYKKD